ncbi:cadmium-translocating P-type ATPase [Caloramator sp. E03]|nr:cadmium-translocating P-type ATPase [Caloramator sp. E03]
MKGDEKMRYVFYLEGLGCANCAAKMEKCIKAIDGVDFALIDFANKKLIIDTDEKNYSLVLNRAKEIVKGIESHVNLTNYDEERTIEKKSFINWKESLRYGLGILFFILMFFVNKYTMRISFAILSYILIGGDILLKAFNNIKKGRVFDENFLMTIATIGAFFIGELPEAISVMLFYKIGETLQDMAVDNSRRSINKLLSLKVDYANLLNGTNILKVKPEDLNIGDLILIKPGERIPVDGIIVEGKSIIDMSSLTGESIPVACDMNSEVLSGAINLERMIKVKVTKTYENSTVKKILDLVENSASNKAKTENFITKFAEYYTPIVVLLAAIISFIPPILGYGSIAKWIYRGLIFLVVSCPCALVISIPLTFFSGIGLASKKGILIKGSNYIEALCNVKSIVFDKTGTLTKGRFKVVEIINNEGFTKEEVLKNAAYGEAFSNHPISKAILDEYREDIKENLIKEHREYTGKGCEAIVEGRKVCVGNSKFLISKGINVNNSITGTLIHVAIDEKYAGYIVIEDEIKEDSKISIDNIKDLGINLYMLTGDSKNSANRVSKILGIDDVYYELLPQDKVEILKDIKNKTKGSVAFVGDGINDAPVLRTSDVGIAMGALGQDAAIEASDVVITTDEIYKVYEAIKLSKLTKKIVMQNIVFAISVKLLVLILAAFGISNMWEAVFADVGVALLAVLNSTRIIASK